MTNESKREARRELAAKDLGPAWRHKGLRKCVGLLELHAKFAQMLKNARKVGGKQTSKTYLGCLRDNARVIRGKILREKPKDA